MALVHNNHCHYCQFDATYAFKSSIEVAINLSLIDKSLSSKYLEIFKEN